MPLGMTVPEGGQRHQVAGLHVERPATDLQCLAVAGVDIDQLDAVSGGVGAGGQDPGHHDAGQRGAHKLGPFDHQAQEGQAYGRFRRPGASTGRELT